MHERFFLSHEFSYEKCSEIFPENFEPLFCGSEKIPGKFPPNFPLNFPNFPAKNPKKFTDELLQERRENLFLSSILVISSQDSSALGYREFAPQWPNVKKKLSSPRSVQPFTTISHELFKARPVQFGALPAAAEQLFTKVKTPVAAQSRTEL